VLDTLTIRNRVPDLSEANITFFGDMANARTVNSSAPLLATMGVRRMNFVAPIEGLPFNPSIQEGLKAQGVEVTETNDLREVAKDSDIIYTVRTQYELMFQEEQDMSKRKALQAEARTRFTGRCLITPDMIEGSNALIMHPLPEDQTDLNVASELRRDPRVIFKEQAANGEWSRMALLALQAGKTVLPTYLAFGPQRQAGRQPVRLSIAS
jgi:aspartate carbamoyltransferase catalytic subunit